MVKNNADVSKDTKRGRLAQLLYPAMASRRMSVQALASAIEVQRQTCYAWLNEYQRPGLEMLRRLARVSNIPLAMNDFVNFLGFINQQLYTKELQRLEVMLMSANFSSIVGEFMTSSIPKYCSSMVKNKYHNGHPDVLPAGSFPNDAAQHANE